MPARIVGVGKNRFLVNTGSEVNPATLAGRLYQAGDVPVPVVGDWVLVRDAVITRVLQRRNGLSRMAAGTRGQKGGGAAVAQMLAANLDRVWIVCGLDRDFNLRRIERYMTMIYGCGIEPVVILTKSDLHHQPEHCCRQVENLSFGVPVFGVSARDGASLSQLASLLAPGQTVALIGSSGAGKSTLINGLSGVEVQRTGAVGDRLGKGRHTTTSRDLIVLPGGGMVIDNPGIREIALAFAGDGAASAFGDIEEAARLCRFRDCTHTREHGCAVLAGIAAGTIAAERLANFNKLTNEMKYLEQRETKSSARVEKERWKEVALKVKSLKKRRY